MLKRFKVVRNRYNFLYKFLEIEVICLLILKCIFFVVYLVVYVIRSKGFKGF